MKKVDQYPFDQQFGAVLGPLFGVGEQADITGALGKLTDYRATKAEAQILASHYLKECHAVALLRKEYGMTGSREMRFPAYADLRLDQMVRAGAITEEWVKEELRRLEGPHANTDGSPDAGREP